MKASALDFHLKIHLDFIKACHECLSFWFQFDLKLILTASTILENQFALKNAQFSEKIASLGIFYFSLRNHFPMTLNRRSVEDWDKTMPKRTQIIYIFHLHKPHTFSIPAFFAQTTGGICSFISLLMPILRCFHYYECTIHDTIISDRKVWWCSLERFLGSIYFKLFVLLYDCAKLGDYFL